MKGIKSMFRLRYVIPSIAILLLSHVAVAQTTTVNSTNGRWTLYPALAESYQTQVNPPINGDGSSNFPAKRGVIPVNFSLFTADGPVVFQSIGSDADTSNDYSALDFAPNKSFTFAQLSSLIANYNFTTGNCHAGALRWSIEFANGGHIYIYYGNDSGFWNDCTTAGSATNQSGLNMINAAYDSAADNRYETGANPGTYVTYAEALAYAASQGAVTDIILVLDGGCCGGDQILSLGNVQIQTSLPTTDTFTPPSSTPTQTCTLPTAQIQVIKTSGSDPGAVNEVLSVSAADTSGYFRVVDCKYLYNLDVSSLPGAGGYTVGALINGTPATNPAKFMLK